MSRQVVHRGLGGQRVSFSGEFDLTKPSTSVMRVLVGGSIFEFSASDVTFGEIVARELFDIRSLSEKFSLQDGLLRVGQAVRIDPSTSSKETVMAAVWQGREHSVITHLYHSTVSDAVHLFGALEIIEFPDGVALKPKSDSVITSVEQSEVVKEIPGVGLCVVVPFDQQSARRLPAWKGTSVASGELFRDSMGNGGTYFVLVTPTAVVTVLPDAGEVEGTPQRLSGLSVQVLN